jgi:hypothetical protein
MNNNLIRMVLVGALRWCRQWMKMNILNKYKLVFWKDCSRGRVAIVDPKEERKMR